MNLLKENVSTNNIVKGVCGKVKNPYYKDRWTEGYLQKTFSLSNGITFCVVIVNDRKQVIPCDHFVSYESLTSEDLV